MRDHARLILASALLSLASEVAAAPVRTAEMAAPAVQEEHRTVHSDAIAGNLLGTSPERNVVVLLPPSYSVQSKRRYPVVYALHGFSGTSTSFTQQLRARTELARAFAAGAPEMIFVFPDSSNAYGGSFYASSEVTGDFETFIADELPRYIDSTYRTIAQPGARGLMGHSMGGYGVARIGMLRPFRFGALYLMSPCCLAPLGAQGLTAKEVMAIAAFKSPREATGAPFRIAGPLATAAAFAPNPRKPPLFVDLAVSEEGKERPDILAKRTANAPLAMIDQHIAQLRTYRAIGIEVGNTDTIVPAATRLHDELSKYHIAASLEVYDGDHSSKIADRFGQYAVPFFGSNLAQ